MERLTHKARYEAGYKTNKNIHDWECVDKLGQLEDLEERLQSIYGECDGLLGKVVEHLERHEGVDLPVSVFKARLLTDEDVDKWEKWKNLEEQGKLLKQPCVVEDAIYHLCTLKNGESEIIEMKVGCVEPCGAIKRHRGICEVWNVYAETDYTKGYFKFSDFGKTVFLTRKEAEAALKEWESLKHLPMW